MKVLSRIPLRFAPVLALTAAVALATGCAPVPSPGAASGPGAAAATPAPERAAQWSPVVSADRLARMIEASQVVVLHVGRGEESFREARIPGARYLPLAAVAVDRNGQRNVLPPRDELGRALRAVGVSREVPVVLYGEMNGLAAARGFFALDAAGHPAVAVLDGGLSSWVDAGHETLSGAAPAPAPGDFIPELDEARIATADEVATLVARDAGARLDARPLVQYTGEVAGGDVERPGHIPGAVSVFWEEDLDADGRLLPLDELRARYERAGAEAGEPVVVYCRTGVQASHAYLVARLLGLNPALYDGSYLEWSNDTDYPVETGG